MVFFKIDTILQRLLVLDMCQVAEGGGMVVALLLFFFADFCPDAAVVG